MPPVHPQQIPSLFQEARQHHAKGDLAQARRAFESILAADPGAVTAHFQLAQVLVKLNETETALDHLDRAAQLRPQEAAIWQFHAAVVQRMANPAKSKALLDKAKKARIDRKLLLGLQETLAPKASKSRVGTGNAPPAEIEKAIALLRRGRAQEAARAALALHQKHPKVAIIANILALAQAELGEHAKAENSFRLAITLDPNYPESRANFGQFLLTTGRPDQAVPELTHALRLLPDMPMALTNLGLALKKQNQIKAAIRPLERALALDPGILVARLQVADAYLLLNQAEKAEKILQPAMSATLPDAFNHVLMGRCLAAQHKNDAAEGAFDQAIRSARTPSLALASKAAFLQVLGRFDEAETLFRQAIEHDPLNGYTYQTFLITRKTEKGDPIIAKMEELYENPEVSRENRMYFGFALAKAMEDTKDYGRVFAYLRPANEGMRKLYPYDISGYLTSTRALIEQFKSVDFQSRVVPGTTDFAPIFVTGLPRSGTTLVEQIIASHSAVTGGGELGFAFSEMEAAMGGAAKRGTRPFNLSDKEIASIGRKIESHMRHAFPDADRMTDKAVLTHDYLGPLKLAIPKARIIVVQRDPRDCLLSMYKNMFPSGRHLYAYDLGDLGEYYHCFQDIIRLWREKAADWLYEISYDALIANPERETRDLIAACGLEWEDQCLSFHENKRRVDTLSVHQVRQPLYASSTKAWQRYEADLEELFQALGNDYAPEKG